MVAKERSPPTFLLARAASKLREAKVNINYARRQHNLNGDKV